MNNYVDIDHWNVIFMQINILPYHSMLWQADFFKKSQNTQVGNKRIEKKTKSDTVCTCIYAIFKKSRFTTTRVQKEKSESNLKEFIAISK